MVNNRNVSTSAAQIDDPQTLIGLFPPDSDDDDDDDDDDLNVVDDHSPPGYNSNNNYCYEIQSIELVGRIIQIRQYDYHSHNANRIWPGLFPLAEYLLERQQQPMSTLTTTVPTTTTSETDTCRCDGPFVHQWGRILELGTATGLLAIRMAMASSEHYYSTNHTDHCDGNNETDQHDDDDNRDDENYRYCCTGIVTSDVDDEYGDVASNLKYNYKLNHMTQHVPYHIPHTWGTGFQKSIQTVIDNEEVNAIGTVTDASSANIQQNNSRRHSLNAPFDTIIASDILLYVSSYPALVDTLSELMIPLRNHRIMITSSEEVLLEEQVQRPDESQLLKIGADTVEIDDNIQHDTVKSTDLLHQQQQQQHLQQPIKTEPPHPPPPANVKFIMSWNRRLKESQEFFLRMKDAGFCYEQHGKGIYTFVYDENHISSSSSS